MFSFLESINSLWGDLAAGYIKHVKKKFAGK